jgi:hypothetical protein
MQPLIVMRVFMCVCVLYSVSISVCTLTFHVTVGSINKSQRTAWSSPCVKKNLTFSGLTNKISCEIFLLPVFSNPGVNSASSINEYQRISLRVKCGQRTEAENSAGLFLSNVKVRVEAQIYITPLRLHNLLREIFRFFLLH